MKMSECHLCEPFLGPELGGKFKLTIGTDEMLILSFLGISKINLLKACSNIYLGYN